MSRPAGIDIFEDKVLREDQFNLQRRAGNLVTQGYIKNTNPSRKELRRLQRLGVELPPELKKKLAKRKRKAKKKSNLKREIARGFLEQKKWLRGQRRDLGKEGIRLLRDDELPGYVAPPPVPPAAPAAPIIIPPAAPVVVPAAPAPPIVIHGVGGGGGGGVPPLGAADIDRIRQAVRGDIAPLRAGQAAAAQAQAQQAAALRQAQADITAARQEQADVRADVVAGRVEGRGGRQRIGADIAQQRQGLEDLRGELEAVREGGFDILQRQRQAQEELRGELGVHAQDVAERREVDLLAQRERDQLIEGQQAQLVQRLDRHHDEFGVAQQYADAMEQAERERLEREAERDRQLRQDIGNVDRRSQDLVDEIRAAQRQQGEAIGERDRRAEERLNAKLDELGGRIGQGDAAREFNEAARQAQYPSKSPRRSRPGGVELERLRAEEPLIVGAKKKFSPLGAGGGGEEEELDPAQLGRSRPRTPTQVFSPKARRKRSPKARRKSPKAGWKGGSSIQDEAQRRPESPSDLRGGAKSSFEPAPEPAPAPLQLSQGFDWRQSVGNEHSAMEAEQSRPKRQLDSERLAPGLEEESAPAGAGGGGGGSELLKEEAEKAAEKSPGGELEKLRAEPKQPKQSEQLEELRQEPETEGGEGFRAGDVGREDVARLEQLGGVELSPEKDE